MANRLLQPMGGCEAPEEKVQEIALGNWSKDSLTWATTPMSDYVSGGYYS
jgi:hypothetical protein